MRINGQGMLPNKTMLEKLEFFTNPEEGHKFQQRKKTLKNQQQHQDVKCQYQHVEKEPLYFLKSKTK